MTSAPSAGRLLVDRYALIEVIGSGPASVVWKAWDETGQREVAVKQIQVPPGLNDLESALVRKKLLREAGQAASFRHPGAVAIHDVFEESGGVCVVMDPFAGPTLAELVAEHGPLSPAAAAQVGRDLSATLEAAHGRGLLHGAVSPSNVVVAPGSPAQLSDFAVSASLIPGPDPALSPFSAPEQTPTMGATPAADLWALGATLRFAVDGVAPSDGATAVEPSRPDEGVLGPVLDALMADDPGARPDIATARRMLEDASTDAAEPAPAVDAPGDSEASSGPVATDAEPTATVESEAEGDAPDQEPKTTREPWFFPVTVEVVPGSELKLLDAEPERPSSPPPPVRRWRTLGIAVMTVGLCFFMLALLSTRPTRRVRLGDTQKVVVPPDWFAYTDPETGFSLSRPPDWRVTDHGTVTDFADPVSGAFFQVDADAPLDASPEDTWRRLETAFSGDGDGYERVRLVPTTFQGRPASIWEYRYTEGAQEMQVVQLGFYAGERPMVLRFQSKAEDWDRHQPDVAAFETSFRTPR